MDRVKTKSPYVGFTPGVGDEAAVPALASDASGALETPIPRRRSWWAGTALRMVRNAAIAVALMAMVPIGMVAYDGDVVWRQNVGANTEASSAIAERGRSFALPKDPSITPMQAGLAFNALTLPQKNESSVFPRRASGHVATFPWESLTITPEMFSTARSNTNNGLSNGLSSNVFAAVVRGISPKERDYLRRVATAPEWREFNMIARAPAADVVGGHFTLPFAEKARWFEFPDLGSRSARELAQASIARSAWFLSTGQVDSAEATLRATISFGFALIDNATTPMDQIAGPVVGGIGRDALQHYYAAIGSSLAQSPGLQPVAKFDQAVPPKLSTAESRRQLLARLNDPTVTRGRRMELLSRLSVSSCGSVKELLFGANDDVRSAIAQARQSLERYPSEKALVDLALRVPSLRAGDISFKPVAALAVSAGSVAGTVLRNDRMGVCTLVAGQRRF